MALDFHKLDNNELLFSLNNEQFEDLHEIFEAFTHWTGLTVDQYNDMKLTIENEDTIIKVIDRYIEKTDLNKDKKKSSQILEFKGLLKYFSIQKIDLQLLGD